MNSFVIASVLSISLAVPCAAIEAQGRGKGQGQAAKERKADKPQKADKPGKGVGTSGDSQKKSPKKGDRDVDVVVVDRDGHARVIREHRGSLPPGLAKRQSLPPGLRRQLIERGALPPGLRTYLVDVPEPWEAHLPAIPSHYHRYFAGDDLIVVDTRTNRIVAIVRDVLR